MFGTGEAAFQTAWFIVSLLTELAVVLVLRTRGSAFASRPSALLAGSSVLVAGIAVAVPWLGPFSTAFGFAPLPPGLLGASLLVVAAYIAATEVAKRRFYRTAVAAVNR